MPIAFTCAGCAKRYEVSDNLAGKRGRCKQCGTEFQIPVPRTLAPRPTIPPSTTPIPTTARAPFPEDEARPRDQDTPFNPFADIDDDHGPDLDDDGEDRGEDSIGPRFRSRPGHSSGGFPELLKNPFVSIVGGGGLLLLLFLLIVVWPSMQGGDGGAVAANGGAGGQAPGIVNVANPSGFPNLPPVPLFLLPDSKLTPIGDLSQHEAVLHRLVNVFNRAADELSKAHDRESFRQATERIGQYTPEFEKIQSDALKLRNLSRNEEVILGRRLAVDLKRVLDRLDNEARRVSGFLGPGFRGIRMQLATQKMRRAFTPMMGEMTSGPRPFIEVFIANVSDQDASDWIRSKLGDMADEPKAGIQSLWGRETKSSSFRIWPVSSAREFASKIDFGEVNVGVAKVTIQANLDPEVIAAFKTQREEEKSRQAALAEAAKPVPDPVAPPGADEITKAIVLLQSSNGFKQREGLTKLARMRTDDARAEEVVKAIEPLAASADIFTAHDAVRALANWNHPEVASILIQVVRTSTDSGTRQDAEKQLGRLQDPSAAAAIADRIKDDWPQSVDALRALGPAAEPAVIPLLRTADSRTRSLACEVLRDIGGQATLDTMKHLPADPDLGVRHAASQTMRAIANRLRAQPATADSKP